MGIVVTPRRRRKRQKIGSEDLDGFVALSVPLVLAIVLADADDGFRFHRSSAWLRGDGFGGGNIAQQGYKKRGNDKGDHNGPEGIGVSQR